MRNGLTAPTERPRAPAPRRGEASLEKEARAYWRWRPVPAPWMSYLAAAIWTAFVLAVTLALLVLFFRPSPLVLAASSLVVAVFVFGGALRRMR